MCPNTSGWYVAWGEYERGWYPLNSGNLPNYARAIQTAEAAIALGIYRLAPSTVGRLLAVRVYRYTHHNGRNPESREMFTLEVGEET